MQCNIPDNYDSQGKILNGLLEIRNVVEAGAYTYLGYCLFFKILPLTLQQSLIASGIFILPEAIFLVIGIGGDSVLQRFKLMRKYRKHKRHLHYSKTFTEGVQGIQSH